MKIQFAAPLKDRHGADVKEPDQAAAVVGQPMPMKTVTLGDVCIAVLDTTFPDENNEGLRPKLRRAELVDKIAAADKAFAPLDLLDSDRQMIRERIGKRNLPPTITAAAIRLLDTPVADDAAVTASTEAPAAAA